MAKGRWLYPFVRRSIRERFRATNDPSFESRVFTRNEDRARREMIRDVLGDPIKKPRSRLRRAKLKSGSPKIDIDEDALRELLLKLRDGDDDPTLSSSVSMRQLRLNTIASIMAMIQCIPLDKLRTFTLLNNGWRYTPKQLDRVTAADIKKQFLTHLRRAGISKRPGFIIAFLHGEFEPTAGVYVLHFHGLAPIDCAEALSDLRRSGAGMLRGWGYDVSPTGSYPIVRREVSNPLHQLTYLLKAFWHEKAIRSTGSGERRDRSAQRIRNPYYVQHLLWLDRQQFNDIAVFSGCRLLRNGELRLAKPVVGSGRASGG